MTHNHDRDYDAAHNSGHSHDAHNAHSLGHSHSHSHDGHGGAQAGIGRFVLPTISFVMLLAGIILDHAGTTWWTAGGTVALIWYAVAFLPVGLPIVGEAVGEMRRGDIFNEFTLMTIACIGAFCIGEYAEAVGVMLFYSVGERLQDGAVDSATRDITRLAGAQDEKVTVVRDNHTENVDPRTVKPGEIIEVAPGGRVLLDGVLLDSDAAFNTAALTGESAPRDISAGDEVSAGMIATGSRVRIRVTRPFADSALSRILKMVREASSRKAPAEQFIRRFARIYTPIVIGLAAALVIVPWIVGLCSATFEFSLHEWLYRALVFLVISCPCALVISIPLGYYAGIGAAARRGILFKGGNYLDAITRADTVAFDKTGTMTTGQFHVQEIEPAGVSTHDLLALTAAVESGSTHPVAAAVTEYAAGRIGNIAPAEGMKEYPGLGAEATVGGRRILAGNLRLLTKNGIRYPQHLDSDAHTLVACAADGRYIGAIFLSDTLKPDAVSAVGELRKLGIKEIALLSGDKPEITAETARQLGITTACGGMMPADKAEWIERRDASGEHHTAFVGDGFNDAPVLAVSTVGIAMGAGSDAAIESADVVIRNDRPSSVAAAVSIGRYNRKIVMQNIVGAIAIKIIILTLGALGYASLWAAVFADVGVALLAVANAMRIMYHHFNLWQ